MKLARVAQRVARGARVVYVDQDPVVLAQALLAASPLLAAVAGDLLDPTGIIGDEEIQAIVDFAEPVALLGRLAAALVELAPAGAGEVESRASARARQAGPFGLN